MKDKIKEIQGELGRAYDSIQKLNMQPTRVNMEISLSVLAAMKDAYDLLECIKEGEDEKQEDQKAKATSEEEDQKEEE